MAALLTSLRCIAELGWKEPWGSQSRSSFYWRIALKDFATHSDATEELSPTAAQPPSRLEPKESKTRRQLSDKTKISVVIPCYNEVTVLDVLFERLERTASQWGTDYEVILVDDGSTDATWEKILSYHHRNPRWRAVRLARNFGHQTALRAGLHSVSGDLVAVLDADLQDPPEELARFFEKWSEGYDVIYGVRQQRKEGPFKRWSYFAFYRVLGLLSQTKIPADAGDFSVMDRRIVDILQTMPERQPFIRALRSWIGFEQVAVPYERSRRAAGRSKYGLGGLVGLALDGILSSSTYPLRLATWLGVFVSFSAFVGVIAIFLMRIFADQLEPYGFNPIPGTASIIISILFLGGVQLLCLGILGEYLGRIYENVKARPLWTVRETCGLDKSAESPTLNQSPEKQA